MWKMLFGWYGKLLYQVGEEVLIKVVAHIIPTHYTGSCESYSTRYSHSLHEHLSHSEFVMQ